MEEHIKTQQIYGYELEGKRFDTGQQLGFIQATIHYALKRNDLSKELKNTLRNLDLK
jgi:UTP--glucose-1-phosphate uridylyltransferase